MKLGEWESTKDLNSIYADARKYGLEQCIAEHDAFGFTVIPPEKAAPAGFADRLRRAILAVHERRAGQRIDPDNLDAEALHKASGSRPIESHWHLIGEDPIFEEVVMNAPTLTMARYLLGKSLILSDLHAALKHYDPAIAEPTHGLHTDQHGPPPPIGQLSHVLNITWALTDYTRDKGALAIVPGSHRFGRIPAPHEVNFLRNDAPAKAIPVECEAGSVVIWGGPTWHGSYPRQVPGLRMNLITIFNRAYMKPIQDYRATTPPEVIARNSSEFARLLDVDGFYPVGKDGPTDAAKAAAFVGTGQSPWA
jgi:ectoine hydroxylase-related dioxygenase (phytanoyl-CoA dioxygenase family)